MKRILLFLLILFLAFPSYAMNQLVASGSVARVDMKISAVNGTSFVDFGVADVLTLNKGKLLVIKSNSNGATIQGWIKAAGSGETLGSEEVDTWVNSTARPYETWTPGAGVLITQAVNSTLSGVCYKVLSTAPTSKLFKCVNSITINSGVLTSFGFGSGGEDFVIYGGYGEITRNATSYITIPLNYANFGLRANSGVAVDFALTDFSLKQVLTPSATGVTIVNSKGGSTYNWSAKDSAFNYNDSAYTYYIYKTPAVLIASGTFTAANARNSFDATTAFCEASGLDLSLFAGTDLGNTPCLIELEDASGDVAWGFGGAVGGGEALATSGGPLDDGELVANPNFSDGDPPTGWTGTRSTLASETGAGNFSTSPSVKITTAAGQTNGNINRTVSLVIGQLYKMVTNLKNVDCTSLSYVVQNNAGDYNIIISSVINPAVITAYTSYGVCNATAANWYFYPCREVAAEGKYAYCDDTSLKQVTDCAATGLHIMSARNGTTRGWKTIGTNFGYNDAMKWRVYYLGS